MNKQTPQGEHTCTHIDCNDPHCEYSKNEIKKRTLRYSALPPQGDIPIDSIKETPTPNKQANELARKAGEKAEKAIDKERLEILWNERQGDSPKNETEKCYLEHVDGYLTCTYNHTIGALCLGNMCKYCGELECKCYDSPKENIDRGELINEMVKDFASSDGYNQSDIHDLLVMVDEPIIQEVFATFEKQIRQQERKEIVEKIKENHKAELEELSKSNNKQETKKHIAKGIEIYKEALLNHLNNK